MRRWVLLEHLPPDQPPHLDLMLERESEAERRLVTFRLAIKVRLEPGQVLEAQRLDDHRAAYLDFEGEISGGRGRVRRLQRGGCVFAIDEPRRLEARIERAGLWVRLEGECLGESDWRLALLTVGAS